MTELSKSFEIFDTTARSWKKFYTLNNYYHKDLESLAKKLIPADASLLEFGCRQGELLGSLRNKHKTGVEIHDMLIAQAKRKYPTIEFISSAYEKFSQNKKYDYILLSDALAYLTDVQAFAQHMQSLTRPDSRIVVVYFNYLWKPILDLAEKLHMRLPQPFEPNWLEHDDITNIFTLVGYQEIKKGNRFIFPYKVPYISDFFNRFIAHLPLINKLCLTSFIVFQPSPTPKAYSVSVIIPARNEAGNMPKVLSKIPKMGKGTEVIFVEGGSKDTTFETIQQEIQSYKGHIKAKLYKQVKPGKKEAVFLGFSKAKNDILMILDADLTVSPHELKKFYDALATGVAEFANGSRLVYPAEKQAMRFLNYLGNKFFSLAFTFLLDKKIKDTLCGTKVLFKKDFLRIRKINEELGDFDKFGDFDLLFGASRLNLKIADIPVRYHPRTYGTTNISRFSHGWLLLKMTVFAAMKLKFV